MATEASDITVYPPKALRAACEASWSLRRPLGEGPGAVGAWLDGACADVLGAAAAFAHEPAREDDPVGVWAAVTGPVIAELLGVPVVAGTAGYALPGAIDSALERALARVHSLEESADPWGGHEKGRPTGHPFVVAVGEEGHGRTLLVVQVEGRRGAPFDAGGAEAVLSPVVGVLARGVRELVIAPLRHRRAVLDRLSRAQRALLPLVLEDLTEPEIAARTERSPHTVHDHVRAIYGCLGVASRYQLRALWEGRRELPPPRGGSPAARAAPDRHAVTVDAVSQPGTA